MSSINLRKHSKGDSTSIHLLIGDDFHYLFINWNILKDQNDKPVAIEKSSINFKSTQLLRITAKDNLIQYYEEEKHVYLDE